MRSTATLIACGDSTESQCRRSERVTSALRCPFASRLRRLPLTHHAGPELCSVSARKVS